jgi:hypothetical protein
MPGIRCKISSSKKYRISGSMRIIIDAQLPESICEYFYNCDCIHTKHLENRNFTKDTEKFLQ